MSDEVVPYSTQLRTIVHDLVRSATGRLGRGVSYKLHQLGQPSIIIHTSISQWGCYTTDGVKKKVRRKGRGNAPSIVDGTYAIHVARRSNGNVEKLTVTFNERCDPAKLEAALASIT